MRLFLSHSTQYRESKKGYYNDHYILSFTNTHIPWASNFMPRDLSYKNDHNWAQRFMYMDIHHNIIYKSEKLETQMSNNRVRKLMMVHLADEILCGR